MMVILERNGHPGRSEWSRKTRRAAGDRDSLVPSNLIGPPGPGGPPRPSEPGGEQEFSREWHISWRRVSNAGFEGRELLYGPLW